MPPPTRVPATVTGASPTAVDPAAAPARPAGTGVGASGAAVRLAWQASLFADQDPATAVASVVADRARGVDRIQLGRGAWVDHRAGWLAGSDRLFELLLARDDFTASTMRLFDREVLQPRLTAHWELDDLPRELALLRPLARDLGARYGVRFARVGCNLYRDGRDGVAWHGDRIARDLPTATIAIVSLGHRRPFRLRPRGGGPSHGFELGRGDLLVMGGTCQRTWQHTVPKVADAGPRISVTFRHDYDEALAARRRWHGAPR